MAFENSDYTVAWISALPDERASAEALLDEEHDDLPLHPGDDNSYSLGKMGKHNVVVAGLPTGTYGTTSAAIVAKNLLRSFPNIRFGLLVGVGGGVPSLDDSRPDDLRLGDIVVSTPERANGGVIQYDFGTAIQDRKFVQKGSLNKPPPILTNALGKLRAKAARKGYGFQQHFDDMLENNPNMKPKFTRPSKDDLYESGYVHEGGKTDCIGCSTEKLISRPARSDQEPLVFYGTIGSANQVLRDAHVRDDLYKQTGIICFEMEAAGLMDNFPCVVIRGICDYADTHKNKEWQPYAGAIAAAFAKELVMSIAANLVLTQPKADQILKEAVNKLAAGQDQQLARLDNMEMKVDLAKLRSVKGAAYNSLSIDELHSKCLENTRVELLKQIREWATAPKGKCVFWLNGMAGTGKSTIARTLAAEFADKKQLGAGFFFKNGEGYRGKASYLFSTIANQLVHFVPETRPLIGKALKDDPDIADKDLRQQFEQLILSPLRGVKDSFQSVVMVIIDALDECDNEIHVKTIIQLLSQLQLVDKISVRVLITSRPELPPRLGFRNLSKADYQDLVLHEIDEYIVGKDIALFLEHKFKEIRSEYDLPEEWPGRNNIDVLKDMAIPLFIFAATVCRFVRHRPWNPKERLAEVLKYQYRADLDQIDKTYRPVLDRILEGENETNRSRLVQKFRDIVGSIVTLADYLSINSLANLLGKDLLDVRCQLDNLHSVLNISADPDHPIRPLHLSFPNYLLDERRRYTNPFWIDEKAMHKHLAYKCIHLLRESKCLKEDICNLRKPGFRRNRVRQSTVARCIPPELQYACRYWVTHLEKGQCQIVDQDEFHLFLKERFLYWLEALSLIGQISIAVGMIVNLQTLLDEDSSPQLAELLKDAWRFTLANHAVADVAPLQLYCSSLAFAPQQSMVRSNYRLPKWLIRTPSTEEKWSSILLTLEHSGIVYSVAFSPDGKQLASGSYDRTVKIWDAATGSLGLKLEHSDRVYSVTFSPDGKQLASGSADKTVKIWDAATGLLQLTFEHLGIVYSVPFSPDGKRLALGSYSRTVKIWDAATGLLQLTLEHSDKVCSVAFSPDGKRLASGSADETVKIWDAATGLLQLTLEHSNWVRSVAFSPDGKQLASGSDDKTAKIWDAATGSLELTLEHSSCVRSVAFSPDGKQLASGSDDETVKTWDISVGSLRQTLERHLSEVTSVVLSSSDRTQLASASTEGTVKIWDIATASLQQTFQTKSNWGCQTAMSPDGRQLALASHIDKTVEIWNVVTRSLQQTLKPFSGTIYSVAFSPDGKQIASGSEKGTVQIWDLATGSLQYELEGCTGQIWSVAFSLDGKQLAWLSANDRINRIIEIWNTATKSVQQIIKVAVLINELSFHPTLAALKTKMGLIKLDSQNMCRSFIPIRETHDLYVKKNWIMRGCERILWLPSEYRGDLYACIKQTLVVGTYSGRVPIFEFLLDGDEFDGGEPDEGESSDEDLVVYVSEESDEEPDGGESAAAEFSNTS